MQKVLVSLLVVGLAACSSDRGGQAGSPAPGPAAACADGRDNDGDALTDFPADPGCLNATDSDEANALPGGTRTRYAMANQCWALKANGNGNFVALGDDGSYAATAAAIADAEPFFMKPTALGSYLFYNTGRQLMSVGTAPALANVASASATDDSVWTVLAVGDTTAYPPTPEYNREPTPEEVAAYRGFNDPQRVSTAFAILSAATGTALAAGENGALSAAAPAAGASQSFSFEPHTGCKIFPEAQSNFTGTPFRGTQLDGTVLGHADVHVHVSSTEFLGGAQWGTTFHKFGVEHALPACDEVHGPTGQLDAVGGLFSQDVDGHDTSGWPDFVEWPGRDQLTHEAIYWKWLERSWAAGLRVLVNDLVDNETLCELQRNAAGTPTRDCNEMNNAGQQAGSMYAMQDYIDAQYGGRGAGFFQIVHSTDEARDVIEDGRMAVVLGIEISNLFDCKLNYSPLRMQRPFEETGAGFPENSYDCTVEEDQPNSILTQMERIHGWGVRQVISIHEFDNAFGGNGIFDGMVLNLGNRENTGGIPGNQISGPFSPDLETPTGELWTTYDCPIEDETEGFSGYLWEDASGSVQTLGSPFGCPPLGQDGRAGGISACYPADVPQCNARWMTPAGLYTYGKMMELGFLFDWDHMEMGMKTQALELAEAQTPVYPFVSTHGTFGGTTVDQARRALRNGSFLYPSNNGSSRGFREDMAETRAIHAQVMADQPIGSRFLFGFGYGTDTNGLSGQSAPRGGAGVDGQPFKPVVYPFTLFSGAPFNTTQFANATPVIFAQPASSDLDGAVKRTWHEDVDGSAHHGMIGDWIETIRLEGTPQDMKDLYNSAEAYLQTWQRTEASSAAISANGLKMPAAPILRPAPPLGDIAP